jgi:hypothetical protein
MLRRSVLTKDGGAVARPMVDFRTVERWSMEHLREVWEQWCWRMVAMGYTSDEDLNIVDRSELVAFQAEFARRGTQLSIF